jgi:PAS domain S-box-containing protein
MGCPFHRSKKTPSDNLARRFFSSITKGESPILSVILDNTIDAIICIDEKGCILFFSKTAEKMLGYLSSEILGENVSILMPQPFADQHDGYIDAYLKTGEKKIIDTGREIAAKKKDGTVFPARLAVSEVFIDGKRVFTGQLSDLSIEKRAQIAEEKSRQIEEQAKIKNAFLTSMSHELRTPLHAMMGFIDCLKEEIDGPLLPEQKDSLERAGAAGKHLLGLINGLLMLSKATRPIFACEKTTCNFLAIVHFCINTMRPLAEKKGIKIIVDFPKTLRLIESDEEGIKQIIFNLLGNAIKFTEKGFINIKIEQVDQSIIMRMKDTGPGIAKENLAHIFFPLTKPFLSDNQSREQGGLGLAITKTIVQCLGGEITVSSKLKSGTEFSVKLPINNKKELNE